MQERWSQRERQIVDTVHVREQATGSDLIQAPLDPPVRPAIFRKLAILKTKGCLKHRKEGRQFVFTQVLWFQQAGKGALNRILDTLFGGLIEDALATHLADSHIRLDQEQLKGLNDSFFRPSRKGNSNE